MNLLNYQMINNRQIYSYQYYFFYMQAQPNQQLPWFKYPLLVCAPMVQQSQLPFRMLTRRHGATLAYTPMLHSKMMTTSKTYKQEHFSTCPQDRPLVAQICGHDPQTMVKAAKMLENEVDAIDINFGCPQGIARKGRYGSFLLQEPDLVQSIVKALSANIKVPIFCKIRVLRSQQRTIDLVKRIQKAGCKLLTVHGRIKQQNKDKVGSCNWQIIKKIKQTLSIPVVANGGIYLFSDVDRCLSITNADGVMSAQALLQNPALFGGSIVDLDELALQYLDLVEKYGGASDSCVRAHLFKMLFTGLSQNVDLRERLVKAGGLNNFRNIASELKQRRAGLGPQAKLGWYLRYWKQYPANHYIKGITAPELQLQKEVKQMKQSKSSQSQVKYTKEEVMVHVIEQVIGQVVQFSNVQKQLAAKLPVQL